MMQEMNEINKKSSLNTFNPAHHQRHGSCGYQNHFICALAVHELYLIPSISFISVNPFQQFTMMQEMNEINKKSRLNSFKPCSSPAAWIMWLSKPLYLCFGSP